MQFLLQCSLANRWGWTFIHWLQQFLTGLEVIIIHKLWNASLVPLIQDLFPATILTCFVTTCIRPLLVHTLNSRLWNTKRFGNLNTVWLNTIAPFLPLRHIYPCWQCYTVPIKTVKVHWPSHFACCAQLSMWPNCCTRSTCETIQLWLQVGWLTFCLGCLFISSVMNKKYYSYTECI